MQMPIDIKAVLDEATNIDEARLTPLSVSIYIDESASAALQAHVRQSFASASFTARVSLMYLDGRTITPNENDDMACIVAGTSPQCGHAAQCIRNAGVPVMVVTASPKTATQAASRARAPYPKGDVIAPDFVASGVDLDEQQANADQGGTSTQSLSTQVAIGQGGASAGYSEPIALVPENIDALNSRMGSWVIAACKEKRLAFALAFPFVRKPLAMETVKATSMQNGGIGLVLVIPGADMPVMTLNQAKMILQIAAAYGEELSMSRVKELAAVVAGGFACRGVARQVCSVVPVAGWAVKAAIGYSGTYAMGRAAIEYYEGGPNVSKLTDMLTAARNKAVSAAAKRAAKGAQSAGASAFGKVKAKAVNVAEGARSAASQLGKRPDNSQD